MCQTKKTNHFRTTRSYHNDRAINLFPLALSAGISHQLSSYSLEFSILRPLFILHPFYRLHFIRGYIRRNYSDPTGKTHGLPDKLICVTSCQMAVSAWLVPIADISLRNTIPIQWCELSNSFNHECFASKNLGSKIAFSMSRFSLKYFSVSLSPF